ncbi:MAG: hypothetical protein HQ522_02750 [Bacteroidetes bacterium]|nr:hypothetical protein [Bacteroidota bacterium]
MRVRNLFLISKAPTKVKTFTGTNSNNLLSQILRMILPLLNMNYYYTFPDFL